MIEAAKKRTVDSVDRGSAVIEFVLVAAPLVSLFVFGLYLAATSLFQTVAVTNLLLDNRRLGLADVDKTSLCEIFLSSGPAENSRADKSVLIQNRFCNSSDQFGLTGQFGSTVFPEYVSKLELSSNLEAR